MVEFIRRKCTKHHTNLPAYYFYINGFTPGERGFATHCTDYHGFFMSFQRIDFFCVEKLIRENSCNPWQKRSLGIKIYNELVTLFVRAPGHLESV